METGFEPILLKEKEKSKNNASYKKKLSRKRVETDLNSYLSEISVKKS